MFTKPIIVLLVFVVNICIFISAIICGNINILSIAGLICGYIFSIVSSPTLSLIYSKYHSHITKVTIAKVFDFAKNDRSRIKVVLAALPVKSIDEKTATGTGEAMSMSFVIDTLSRLKYRMNNIDFMYSNDKSLDPEGAIDTLLDTNDVILLGGPVWNRCTKKVFERYNANLPFVFANNHEGSCSTTPWKPDETFYTGEIVKNINKNIVVASPSPFRGCEAGACLNRDCGLVIKLKNRSNKTILLLAGGRTAGVWIASEMATSERFLKKICKDNKNIDLASGFSAVAEFGLTNEFIADTSASLKQTSDVVKINT